MGSLQIDGVFFGSAAIEAVGGGIAYWRSIMPKEVAAMIGCPQCFVSTREGYFGACTTIRLAVMVKVPLMLGIGLPSRS